MQNKERINMEKIRIQDDLYHYVNQEWLEKAVIPDDKPTAGGFADLAVDVEKTLIADLNKMCESGNYPNAYLERACNLYKAFKDVKKKSRNGARPALKNLKKIKNLTGIPHLNRSLKEFVLQGYPLPFSIAVEDDMKDSNKHCLYLQGPSVILPDTTYYKEGMEAQKEALLGIWKNMAAEVLKCTRLTEEERALYVEDTVKFDAIVATLVKSSEEWSEYTKSYNPMKTRTVGSMLKPINFRSLLKNLFGFVPETVVVAEPRFLKGFKTLFNAENFELYKHWAYVTRLLYDTNFLSEKLRELGSTYRRALSGVAKIPSAEKFGYQLTGQFYAEPIGLYYGEKYFGEEAKKDVVDMVQQIIDTYKKRVAENDFLADATKEKAILKLSKMRVKMGYPDKVDEFYDKLVFTPEDSLYDIVIGLLRIRREHSFSKLTEPVNKDLWVMPGHMVNACYNPTSNDITFPAAILQAPFYSIKQTRSQNLGGIGAVIGHEISHAFDNNGAKCDENGNLNNWWTKEDNKKFTQKTKAMIKQFDGIELPWGKVNGTFIVSENIADNGGMAVTLDIMSRMENANYEEYFVNWAKVWCVKAKPEYQKLLLSVDVHGPALLRANMPPRNFEEWYTTFGVNKTDKMYIAPTKRVVIW